MAYGKIKADTIIYDNGGTDVEVTTHSITTKVDANNPTLTGTVTIPTPTSGDNSTKAASTAFVVAGFAPKPATAGTVGVSEVVQVDANKDTSGIRNLTITGDLNIGGTTTTINSTTLTVADKNIELAQGSSTDAAADGGGITLKGATDKTITWVDSTDAWTFNQNISTTGTIKATPAKNANNDGFEIIPADGTTASSFKILGNNNAGADGRNGGVTFIDANYYDLGSTIFNIAGRGTNVFSILGNGNVTAHTGSISDSKGELRTIPQNTQASAYTLVAGDHGKHILASGDITVPDNVFTAGQAITIINNTSGNITINKGTTMYWGVDGSDANRTLGTRGCATLLVSSGTVTYITGAGLS